MEEKINLLLTKEEYSSILEALLFSCSVDVSSDWDYEDIMKFKNLLIKMRIENQSIPTKRVNSFTDLEDKIEYNDIHTEELLKYFPEIQMEEKFV